MTEARGQGGRSWLVLAVIGLGSAMSTLDTFIVNVALPSLRDHLHASSGEVEFVVTAYALTYAVLLITGGRIGDLYGRTRVYLIGLAVFTVASAVSGAAPTASVLIGARVFQAASAAAMVPQAYSVVQLSFPPAERVRAISLLTSANSLSVILAQLVGGGLIQANIFGLGWRVVFLVNVPLGVVGLVAGWFVLPRDRPERSTGLDLAGVGLASVALGFLAVPLVEGRDLHWAWWLLLMLLLAPVAVGLLLAQQRRRARTRGSPLLELGLFHRRSFSAGLPLVAMTQVANAGLFFILAIYLQSGRHLSPGLAGLTFAPLGLGYLCVAPLSPRIAARLGRATIAIGYCIVGAAALSMILLLRFAGGRVTPYALIPGVAFVGVGQAFVNSPLFATVLSHVPSGQEGAASGFMSTVQQTGAALGVALAGLIFFGVLGAAAGSTGLFPQVPASHAFATALWLMVAIDGAAALGVALLPSYAQRPDRRSAYAAAND